MVQNPYGFSSMARVLKSKSANVPDKKIQYRTGMSIKFPANPDESQEQANLLCPWLYWQYRGYSNRRNSNPVALEKQRLQDSYIQQRIQWCGLQTSPVSGHVILLRLWLAAPWLVLDLLLGLEPGIEKGVPRIRGQSP